MVARRPFGRLGQRPHGRSQEAIDFIGNSRSVALDVGQAASARVGVGIRAGSDGHECECARMPLLNQLLGNAGPVAVHEVVAGLERCRMTRVIDEHRAKRAVRAVDGEHRQVVIDSPARRHSEAGPLAVLDHATVRGEAGASLRPGHTRRAPVGERGARDTFELAGEGRRVAVDDLLLWGGRRHVEDVGEDPRERGSRVRMRRADDELIPAHCVPQPARDLLREGTRHADQVDRDQHRGRRVVAERKCPGPQALTHIVCRLLPVAIASEPDGLSGGDINLSDANRNQAGRALCAARSR